MHSHLLAIPDQNAVRGICRTALLEKAKAMKLFAFDDEVAELEAELPDSPDAARLNGLVTLSWHLRQRNTPRAVALSDEAEVLLRRTTLPECERQHIDARLLLIRGEAKWLFAALEDAEALANRALRTFTLLDDAIGCTDAHWLLGFIANDRGDQTTGIAELAFSARASNAVDGLRANAAKAALARLAIFPDPGAARTRWSRQIDALLPSAHPGLAALANDFRAALALEAGDFGSATAFGVRTYYAALATGQVQRAIIAATLIGTAFARLNDLDNALEWMQRGLDLARPTGWPTSIGRCLLSTGHALHMLGQAASARERLNEALDILKPFPATDVYATALLYLTNLVHQQGTRGASTFLP